MGVDTEKVSMLAAGVFALLAVSCGAIRYDGYQGLEVGPIRTKEQAQVIDSLRDEHDFTRQVLVLQDGYAKDFPIDMVVSPGRIKVVRQVLEGAGIPFRVVQDDIQGVIEKNNAENEEAKEVFNMKKAEAKAEGKMPPVPDYYMRYDEMVTWMQDTVNEAVAAGVDARMVEIGASYEGRMMYLIEVNADSNLPKTFLDAGIHAREWMAHATGVWIIHEILLGTSAEAVDMRTNYAWYLSPCINPDGYEYTWDWDRYWRKNREPNDGSVCVGTDLNRNWDANWSECGVSRNPCEDTYSGDSAASCIETQLVMATIEARAGDLGLYISMHAYSQLWLLPWGGSEQHSADYDDLMTIALDVVDSIEAVNGRAFTPGTVPDVLYCGAGGSMDWVKNGNPSYELSGTGLGIKYTYAPELRPATAIGGGFELPPEEIPESGEEIFAGVVTAVKGVHG